MGLDIGALMAQAKEAMRRMEERKAEIETKLAEITVTGSSGGGAVEVALSADRQVRRVSIKPEVIDAAKADLLEDLVYTALGDALRKADQASADEMAKMSDGIEIGGFDLNSIKGLLG